MRNVRVAVLPILLMAAATALAWWRPEVHAIAHFSFIWDVLLGAVLGALLALLPQLSGFTPRRNAATGMFWVCGFVSLLLIFYQYATMLTGLSIEAISFLAMPNGRMRVIEGAFLGYCSVLAGRGKI